MEEEFDNAFSVMPMNQSVTLIPGQVFEGMITLANPVSSTRELSYQVQAVPYNVSNEDYNADFLSESDRTAIAKWITIDEPTGTLQPNESRDIKFTINVPYDVPAGGQYAAIAVSSKNDENGSDSVSVKNVFEIASIIYADIAGETVHSGEVVSNNIPEFAFSAPVKVSSQISNGGNVHEKAVFTITIVNALDGQTIFPTPDSDESFTEIIMPDSTRVLEREISNLPMVGVVKVSQSISYLDQTSYEERTMIICPIWLMVLVLVVISAIITAIVVMVRKHRKRGNGVVL